MRTFAGLRVGLLALCTGLVGHSSSYGDEREDIKLRIQEIKKQAAQLLEEGRKDKAAGLMREQEELMGILRRMTGEGKAEGRGPSPEQMEKFERAMQKVRHLRIASEHLKQADMHDMALELMRQAEGIEQDLRNAKEKMAGQMRDPKGPEGRGLDDRLNSMQRELEELRNQNQQLRMMIEKIASGLRQPKVNDAPESNPKKPQIDDRMVAFAKRLIDRLDKDKNGLVTSDEWTTADPSFSDVDINKDGKVNLEEYAKYRKDLWVK
ncbi:MAG: hypothetical protein ACK5E3_05980 [Planctomycetota bacterium]